MSGVIDEHGQWERCNGCGQFVMFAPADGGPGDLCYERPSADHQYGRDLCRPCMGMVEEVRSTSDREIDRALAYAEAVLNGAVKSGNRDRASFLKAEAERELDRRAVAV